MRHAKLSMLGLVALSLLSACSRGMNDAEVQKAMRDVNVIDESRSPIFPTRWRKTPIGRT